MVSAPVAACACGRCFDAAGWLDLPFVGLMEDGEGGWLELRNCSCRSTVSVEVPARAPRSATTLPAPPEVGKKCPGAGKEPKP